MASVLLGLGAAGWLWLVHVPNRAWDQAQAALARHDLAAAAVHLERYLERRPDDAAGWFLAGRTARRRGQYDEAEQFLERSQKLSGVTEATRLEWDLLRVQQGELGDVHLRLRGRIGPDHPDAAVVLEALARGYLATDRLRDLLEACDLWLTVEPDHPWPWLWRGGTYERLGNFHQALEDYRAALKLAPEDLEVRRSLAALHVRARQPEPAIEHFEYVLQQQPDDEEAVLGLATCRLDQGRADAAQTLLAPVLAQATPPARALLLGGKAALAQDDPVSAERLLAHAARMPPVDPEVLHQYMLALRAQGKQEEAEALATRLEQLRNDTNRIDQLIRAIARSPDDPALRHEAGVIALRLGRTEDGLRWLEGALRVPGDHRATHLALADHFSRQGARDRAEIHRRLAEGR